MTSKPKPTFTLLKELTPEALVGFFETLRGRKATEQEIQDIRDVLAQRAAMRNGKA